MANAERDVLAQCLQEIERGEVAVSECLARYPEHRDALAPLLDVAVALRAAPEVAPRAFFRQAARHRLLGQIASRRPVTFWDRLAARWQPGLQPIWMRSPAGMLALILIVSMVLFGGSRAVSASEGALPGDVLYPVKVTVEDVRLALAGDEVAVQLYLEFAGMRVHEMERLATAERFEDMPAAVNRLERQLQSAADSADEVDARDASRSRTMAEELKSSVSSHRGRLEALLGVSPASVRPVIERALEAASEDVEDEAEDGPDADADSEDEADVSSGADVGSDDEADISPDKEGDSDDEAGDVSDADVDSDEADERPDEDANAEDETDDVLSADSDSEDETDISPDKEADSDDEADESPDEDADSAHEADDDPDGNADSDDEGDVGSDKEADSDDEVDDVPDADGDSEDGTDDGPDGNSDSADEADDGSDGDSDSEDEANDSSSGSDDRPGNGSGDESRSDSDVDDEPNDESEDDSGADDSSGSDNRPEHGSEGDSDENDEDD